ncbi:hypothetical protein SASPL_121482 [Salvia splendens]|uniref:DUF641 domain-containing protein n=1 Tax=Salvia splendens TaxID=180675 RepID=A0A8X8XXE0_SALSN|nr:hypothetical protein SASPL_121482 [Salvia splendens]
MEQPAARPKSRIAQTLSTLIRGGGGLRHGSFVAKLFASVSAAKAAYAELQLAQIPYNRDAIRSADQAVVDQLKALSDLKQRYANHQIDSSPPHVTLVLAEIQEHQSLLKTYEITMREMQAEIDAKEARIASLQNHLRKSVEIERKMNASGSIDGIRFSDVSHKDFTLVLHYLEVFSGFTSPGFGDESVPGEIHEHDRRRFFFDQFRVLRSASAINFAKQSPNSLFGEFLKSKYLQVVHPKMESSFTGNLYQREMMDSGEFPETEFFKAFAEMGRRLWLLHSLSFSFDYHVSVFQVSRNSKFSQVYMESVTDKLVSAAADGEALRVAFTVVPGFKVGKTVVQSQVYLSRLN